MDSKPIKDDVSVLQLKALIYDGLLDSMCRGLILSNILFNVMITIHRKRTVVVWLTHPVTDPSSHSW